MISRILSVVLLIAFFCPSLSFAYIFKVRTAITEPTLTADNVGQVLAFEIFKASLSKLNIPHSEFSQYGTGSSFSINNVSELELGFDGNGSNHSSDGTLFVVLWPRVPIDNTGIVDCDYAVFGTFHHYHYGGPSSQEPTYYQYYIYFDSGVVSVVNYLGPFWNTPFANKRVVINYSLQNTMPIQYYSNSILKYFETRTRTLNLNLTGKKTDILSSGYGSVAELFSYQFSYAFLKACGNPTSNTANNDKYFDLRNVQNISQSSLPWQLQVYNTSFDTNTHTQPTDSFLADTDLGTEPDLYEYYNGHDFLNPDDDWGQPADIGGVGSGVGGEIERLGPEAEQQVQEAVQEGTSAGLENYFGDPDDTDIEIPDLSGGSGSVGDGLDPEDYDEELEDVEPDDTWLTQVRNGVFSDSTGSTNLLPAGVSTFQSLVNRLKSPSLSGSLPVWTLDLEVDTGNIAGVVFEGATVDIDLNTLVSTNRSGSSVNSWLVTLRYIVVIFMTVCVLIYIIKDCMLLGGNSDVA